ncbi:MAG: efflux RND transporter periplasmic adaptor subunit [Salaquimonas sp.]
MSILKQFAVIIFVLLVTLAGWVYFDPNAIGTLAKYKLDIAPLRQIAVLSEADGSNANEENTGKGKRGPREALVITAPVSKGIVNDRLNAIGNGRAAQYVTVTSLVSGQIVELPAGSGDKVEAGAVIARLDAENEALALERAKLTAADLKTKTERAKALFKTRSTTAAAAETAEVAYDNAALAVREAQLNLDRRTIRSPIDGLVGIITANIGDYVTNQTPIVTIDDRSKIIIEFFVPERFATSIKVGSTVSAVSVARPGEQFTGEVVAIDNRVDIASRTLQVRAEIPNTDDQLRAGMAFKVEMRFDGEEFSSVDPLAIQWDSNGSYVWQIDTEGKAVKKPARIVQRNPESVLVEAELVEGDLVVTEGIQNLRAGANVKIMGNDNSTAKQAGDKAVGS